MSILKEQCRIILGEEYRTMVDENKRYFINLTSNDILIRNSDNNQIIPKSGHIAYIMSTNRNVIVGLPPKSENTFLIVEYSVFRVLPRADMCISVECKEIHGDAYILPVVIQT